MDIIKAIKADHDEVAELFEQLAHLAGDDQRTSDAMRTAVRLAIAVKIHAHAEERVVYDAMRDRDPRLAAFSREGRYEHSALDMLLDRLIAQRPGPELVAILKVARDQFEHHARHEEEAVILPLLVDDPTPTESLSLAHDFIHERRRIRPSIERLVGPAARGTHDGRGIHISHHRR
jgi:hemerythrin superfamily protein